MYGIPRDEVEQIIETSGGRIVDVLQDTVAGRGWLSYRYCAVREGQEVRRRGSQTEHPESQKTDDPAQTGLQPAGDGRMWLDDRYRAVLENAGLAGFDDVMGTSHGRCLRVLHDRENWYLPRNDARPSCGMYLKKHRIRTWWTRVLAKLGVAVQPSAGRVEAENIGRLTALGIDAMNLVAYGETLHDDGSHGVLPSDRGVGRLLRVAGVHAPTLRLAGPVDRFRAA